MFTAEEIIKAYEDTNVNPVWDGSTYSAYGACAIGVYYLWMNSMTLIEATKTYNALNDTHLKAHSLFDSLVGRHGGISNCFGAGFDQAMRGKDAKADMWMPATKDIYQIGYNIGCEVKEHFDNKKKVEEPVLVG